MHFLNRISLPKMLSCLNSNLTYHASFDCNNCSKKTKQPQCKACHRMVSYFNIFNIPQQYNIDEKIIADKAKSLQKQYHPDKYQHLDLSLHQRQNMQDLLKQKMTQYSTYINEAKSTLLDSLKRAVYLMQLKGIQIQDNPQIQDNAFMMEMFTLQEQIEDGSHQKCQQIQVRIQNILKNLQIEFDNFFKSDDMEKCKQFIYKYKYLHRALVNVKQKLGAQSYSQGK